jgi:NAD+ synthase
MATEKVDITPAADAFLAWIEGEDLVRRGNVMARCRMIVLYDRSARDHSLVLGTGNRTEGLLGYTTLFGDSACALNPVGQLYKTEIRALSAHLGLPAAVLNKEPSADLWAGQSDEDELGMTYSEVDRLLAHMVDEGLGVRQLIALGFAEELIVRVQRRVRSMAFKRATAPVCTFPDRRDPDLAERLGPAPGDMADKDGGFH